MLQPIFTSILKTYLCVSPVWYANFFGISSLHRIKSRYFYELVPFPLKLSPTISLVSGFQKTRAIIALTGMVHSHPRGQSSRTSPRIPATEGHRTGWWTPPCSRERPRPRGPWAGSSWTAPKCAAPWKTAGYVSSTSRSAGSVACQRQQK